MRSLACLMFLLAALPVQARTFCCDVNGRTYCDEGVPPACYGKAYRELDGRGQVARQIEAPLTPEQAAKRAAEKEKKRIQDEKAAEEEKRDRKLLATYATVEDLDEARERVLGDLNKGLVQTQQKLAEAEKKQKALGNESEFYKKRAMPEALKAQLRANELELKAQQKNVADRQQDIEAAKQKFTDDRRRYQALTARDELRAKAQQETKPR